MTLCSPDFFFLSSKCLRYASDFNPGPSVFFRGSQWRPLWSLGVAGFMVVPGFIAELFAVLLECDHRLGVNGKF